MCNTLAVEYEENPAGPVRPADVALLGLLAEGPKHPWEITKEVNYREMRTWTDLSQSTIYKQLHALEDRGLVEVREEPVGGRMRRVYSITEAGRRTVSDGVLSLLAIPEYPHWAIDIATYNVDLTDPQEAVAALESYAETLRERADGWGKLEEFLVGSGCPSHRLALSRRARHLIEGELRWLGEFVDELRAGAGAGADAIAGKNAVEEPR
ncbi:MAG: hypothetical protein QG622_297 [Actinomycetota bacterium]|nr:hypothetical protein [Actinomycetota bacterium]